MVQVVRTVLFPIKFRTNTAGAGNRGVNSSFNSIVSNGGGGGSNINQGPMPRCSKEMVIGSGGGSGIGEQSDVGQGTSGQGNNGGSGVPHTGGDPNYGGGGGGGASAVGANGAETSTFGGMMAEQVQLLSISGSSVT